MDGVVLGAGKLMRRRDFIATLGFAAVSAWARGARAQAGAAGGIAPQSSNAPLVGFLNSASPATYRFNADSFREGLKEAGFIEGQNVRIEERWANGDYQALPPNLWRRAWLPLPRLETWLQRALPETQVRQSLSSSP